MPGGKVAVFGVPSAAGARGPGSERAPFVLREAGLLEALRADGRARREPVRPLALPVPRRPRPPHARATREVVACAVRATADEMTRALAEGFTVVLGGDCTLAVGTVGGARAALGQPVGLVYLDANADLNTPETTPSGFLCGMALALALGRGPAEVVTARRRTAPAVGPSTWHCVGFRALDPGERQRPRRPRPGAARRGGARAGHARGGGAGPRRGRERRRPARRPPRRGRDRPRGDAGQGPRSRPAPGSRSPRCRTWSPRSLASPRVVALEVAEYDPERDPDGAARAQARRPDRPRGRAAPPPASARAP